MAESAAASLSLNERKVLQALENGGNQPATAAEVAPRAGLAEQEAVSALNWLATKGLAAADQTRTAYASLGAEGEQYASEGLPERRVADTLRARGGRATLPQLFADGVIKENEVPIVLG